MRFFFAPIPSHQPLPTPCMKPRLLLLYKPALHMICFILNVLSTYWDEGAYTVVSPPTQVFADILAQVQSRFFTMDIAQQIDGRWMIVELGDGQVAGLPETLDTALFYEALIRRCCGD